MEFKKISLIIFIYANIFSENLFEFYICFMLYVICFLRIDN